MDRILHYIKNAFKNTFNIDSGVHSAPIVFVNTVNAKILPEIYGL